MAGQTIRFDDGASYERMMGTWSRIAGEIFLEWIAPRPDLRWIDIGCGNGAFTELLVDRCAPAEVEGIDPSEGQLAFARTRPAARRASFHRGDAMALPYPADRFDAAVMALVIVFVPDPARSVDEMVRVVRPGGMVATYVWDMLGGGFPLEPILAEMRAIGLTPPNPPQNGASRLDALRDLWTGAGLERVETREIVVQRTFADFDDFWTTNLMSATVGPAIAALDAATVRTLEERVRARLPAGAGGRIAHGARAHAIAGYRPQRSAPR
ncbi:MAG: methyltransferase domain-containing protein [Alphaproteobacteria bacterium]